MDVGKSTRLKNNITERVVTHFVTTLARTCLSERLLSTIGYLAKEKNFHRGLFY
jgi:hypothetical protein